MKRFAWWALFVVFLIPSAAWAKGVSIGEATDEQKEAAKLPYIEGRKAFDEGRHDDALKHFQASYDIVASPNSHHMVAMALRELGKLAEAYEMFGEVAAEADAASSIDEKYSKAAENARAKRDEMMSKIGFINLEINNPDGVRSLKINDRPIERSRWTGPIPATPGDNSIVFTMSSGEEKTESVMVTAGGKHDVKFGAAPEPTEPTEPVEPDDGGGIEWLTPYRITAYAVVAAGLISFGIAGGLGSAAQSKHDDLATACPSPPCPTLEDDISSGESLQVATNVMIVVGAVLVAGGAALWLVAPDAKDGLLSEESEPDDDASDLGIYLAPTPSGLMLGGQF